MPLRSRKFIENDRAESAVLLISPYPEDETFLRDVVNGSSFRLEVSLDWRTARTGSPLSSFPVIITERDLPDAGWENVFSDCERLLNLPRLIVISRLADERLWAEVLNRRGFDVLAKPFDRDEVTRVLGLERDDTELADNSCVGSFKWCGGGPSAFGVHTVGIQTVKLGGGLK